MAEVTRASTRTKVKRLNRSRLGSVSHRKQSNPRKCECIVMEELRVRERPDLPPRSSGTTQLEINTEPNGAVTNCVDLTGDNVEGMIDLTNQTPPHPLRISLISPPQPLRPSCRYASSLAPPPPVSPDVVFLQATNEDVIIVDSHARKRKQKKNEDCIDISITTDGSDDLNIDGKGSKGSLSCPVCLQTVSQFEARGQKLVTTICGHIFCNSCIRNSISTMHKCPTCRRKLTLNQYHQLFL